MQSITALAHLRACILFFIDLSEQCGYSIKDQVKQTNKNINLKCALFHSLKPLFATKPIYLIINKIDVMSPEQLHPDIKQEIDNIENSGVTVLRMSCFTDVGIMEARNAACDALLAMRVENKMQTGKVTQDVNKLLNHIKKKGIG